MIPQVDYQFDNQAADNAVLFFHKYLVHTDGEWAGQPFLLQPWQETVIRELFGTKKPDGTRRYRTCYLSIARKNGKTQMGAGLALWLLFGDKEPGAQIVSAAADREQAAICFEAAKKMVEASPVLSQLCRIYRRSIVVPKTGSSYKVISAEAYSKFGSNLSGILFDELFAQPTRELWDALTTSMGARRQPLVVAMTTAGWDRNSICYELHERAIDVIAGRRVEDTLLPVVYSADPKIDWKSEEAWKAANPNFGVTVKPEYFVQKVQEATNNPNAENVFKNLHLNLWVTQAVRWFDMARYDACSTGPIDPAELIGKPCYGGLDLAYANDFAAFVLLFKLEKGFKVLPHFWLPEEQIDKSDIANRDRYRTWEQMGLVEFSEGDTLDFDLIYQKVNSLGEKYRIQAIAADKTFCLQLGTQLQSDGFNIGWIPQKPYALNAPSKELERLVMAGELDHGQNPVLRWMAENVAVRRNRDGYIMPSKQASSQKIDGIVALVNAIGAMIGNPEGGEAFYLHNRLEIMPI